MIPLEIIVIGSILSFLNVLLTMLLKTKKFKAVYDKLNNSQRKLQSIQESIKSSSSEQNMTDDDIMQDAIEFSEALDDVIKIMDLIEFTKPK